MNKVDRFKIPHDRNEDIRLRGRDTLVHDYDGTIVKLSQAKMWYNYDSDYVAPREVEQNNNYVCTDCILS